MTSIQDKIDELKKENWEIHNKQRVDSLDSKQIHDNSVSILTHRKTQSLIMSRIKELEKEKKAMKPYIRKIIDSNETNKPNLPIRIVSNMMETIIEKQIEELWKLHGGENK